jgi:hypothetical protein
MQVPPTLDKLDYFSYSPFTTAAVPLIHLAIGLETGVRAVRVSRILESALIPNEDDAWLKVLFMQEAILCSQFLERGKTVGCGVVDGDLVLIEWAVDGEEIVEVNKILPDIQLIVHQDGLLRLLFLEHESLYSSLWIYNGLEHNLIFLIIRQIYQLDKRHPFLNENGNGKFR